MTSRADAIRVRWSRWIADPWHYDDRVQYVRSAQGVLIGEICGLEHGIGETVAEAPRDIAHLLAEVERLTRIETAVRHAWKHDAFDGCDDYDPGDDDPCPCPTCGVRRALEGAG